MSIWILWMILAAVFLVAEIFTAGFFLMWFGIGAAVAGLLALVGVGFAWQLAAFIVVSLFLFIMTRQITAKMVQEQPPGIGADRLLDQEVMVVEEINHLENRGRIRLKGEEWRAESLDHSTIPAGTTVKVVRVSGTRLIVQ